MVHIPGECYLCGGFYSKAGMINHLKACKQKHTGGESKEKSRIFHLVVDGVHLPEYWVHLEVKGSAKLKDVDNFLRDVWLECCGHLSAFTIEGTPYFSQIVDVGDRGMTTTLNKVLSSGLEFFYEYDFGTATELGLRVVSERKGTMSQKIRVLARNKPPQINCECGRIAKWVCAVCNWEGEGWLCDSCADEHECGEEMFLPVVNSPRVGVCAYGLEL